MLSGCGWIDISLLVELLEEDVSESYSWEVLWVVFLIMKTISKVRISLPSFILDYNETYGCSRSTIIPTKCILIFHYQVSFLVKSY